MVKNNEILNEEETILTELIESIGKVLNLYFENNEPLIAEWLQERKGQLYKSVVIFDEIKGILPVKVDIPFALNVLSSFFFKETLKRMVESGTIKMIHEGEDEYYYYE